jgi:hypothetical protein
MIKMSSGPGGESFSIVALVAFDPASGDVHATYLHGYHGELDEAATDGCREKLLKDVRRRLGAGANVEVVQVRLADLEGGWIERVDPTTRAVVIRRERDSASGITRP